MAARDEWVDRVRTAERRGDQLLAFDLAERGLEEHPDDLWLRHRAVLALARAGSTGEAARRFSAYELGEVDDVDVQSLRARIAKDQALAMAEGGARAAGALRAASLYQAVFARTGNAYPGINAATLLLLAGREEDARALARALLRVLPAAQNHYYDAATRAEALLILGDAEGAADALRRAALLHDGDWSAVAATRRQLRLICATAGLDDGLLGSIAASRVVHFCGHRLARDGQHGRLRPEDEDQVAVRVATELYDNPPVAGYGSLASGSDIICAETLLRLGAELHVVLPFAADDFVTASVADAGKGWAERFSRCLGAATTVTLATEEPHLGDEDVLFRYGADLAMGLVLLRARVLDAPAQQIAVWDGSPAAGAAGTAVDVATWRHGGRETVVIAPGASEGLNNPPPDGATSSAGCRVVRALMFADIYGFSRLADHQLPSFVSHVLAAVAHTLDRFDHALEYCNTWGDALYAVFTSEEDAAACALDLHDALGSIDLESQGLPDHLALRVGLHRGPVIPTFDPVTRQAAFMGSHVSRTARIEPVTPPGAVYVTDHMAAALALHTSRYVCDYVGHVPAAKNFGRLRMYRLRRNG